METVNEVLSEVREMMQLIRKECSQLKTRDSAIIQDILVTANAWKVGIRKIQSKIANFYEIKMKHFSLVNSSSRLNLQLVTLKEKEWAKECFSRMTAFCICG